MTNETIETFRLISARAARIVERHAPAHLREAAFMRAVTAIRENRDPDQAVLQFVQEKL